MARHGEEGPVYYREIQKNAYLKRIPPDPGGSKLRPLGHKKPPLKAMWTLFCVHNGRTPYLEQYPDPDSPLTAGHKPTWRASLRTARHVTASVKPWPGDQFDFLIATDEGSVRMLAPDWSTMQDWVSALRSKLHELRVLGKGENVYCAAPAPAAARACSRDPTSPLPPTPATPPVRVPGIELAPQRPAVEPNEQAAPAETEEPAPRTPEQNAEEENIWDSGHHISLPSTSQAVEPKSLTKICGQNICLDNSILMRSDVQGDSSEEFFEEIDRCQRMEAGVNDNGMDYKQRLIINSESEPGASHSIAVADESVSQQGSGGTNITVIQVSNNRAPHTAIPVLGPERVFNFDFQQLSINDHTDNDSENFVNIVNTEGQKEEEYGRVFADDATYGHLSMTTTVNLPGSVNVPEPVNGVYERLCLASTSKSPLLTRKDAQPANSAYEYLYPSNTNGTEPLDASGVRVVENGNHMSTVGNVSVHPYGCNGGGLRNLERSNSQSSYDNGRLKDLLLRGKSNKLPKWDSSKSDQKSCETHHKPIWKRGLTELSLLSRLRGFTQSRGDRDSPTRENSRDCITTTSPVRVVHRSRAGARVDSVRRRSSSLSNEGAVGGAPLRARRAGEPARLSPARPPVFADADGAVWVARWGGAGAAAAGRAGDRVAGVRGARVAGAAAARAALAHGRKVDILFHRVPHGKMFILRKKTENESLASKLPFPRHLSKASSNSLSSSARAPAQGSGCTRRARGRGPRRRRALTEVDGRQIDLLEDPEEEMLRLSSCGTEVSILIQPTALVRKLRAAVKAQGSLLNRR